MCVCVDGWGAVWVGGLGGEYGGVWMCVCVGGWGAVWVCVFLCLVVGICLSAWICLCVCVCRLVGVWVVGLFDYLSLLFCLSDLSVIDVPVWLAPLFELWVGEGVVVVVG